MDNAWSAAAAAAAAAGAAAAGKYYTVATLHSNLCRSIASPVVFTWQLLLLLCTLAAGAGR